MLATVDEANIAEFLKTLQEKHDITFRIPDDTKKSPRMPYEQDGDDPELVKLAEKFKAEAAKNNVTFDGFYERIGKPPIAAFTDTSGTHTSFTLEEGETVAQALARKRALFGYDEKKNLYKSFVPAAVTDKINTMADVVLNRPQELPADVLKDIKANSKNQTDFKVFDKYFGLPWWNAQKYEPWEKAFRIFGINRPATRGSLINEFAQKAEPFLMLDVNMKQEGFSQNQIQDAKSRIQKIIIAGDALLGKELNQLKHEYEKEPEGTPRKIELKARIDQIKTLNRYSNEELRAGIKTESGEVVKLNDRECQVYASVRAALDDMFDTYYAHLQAQAFRTYSKQKWYAVLCQAAGADLNKDAVSKLLNSGLRGAALTYAKRIQSDIQKIFARIEEGVMETPDIEKKQIGEIYTVLADKLTKEVARLRDHLGAILGLEGEELTKATKDVLAAYVRTKPELKRIRDLRNAYGKQVAFFPRVREQGAQTLYLVEHILDDDGNPIKDRKIHSEMFTGEAEHKALYKKYLAKYAKNGKLPENWEILRKTVVRTPELAFQGINDINMQKVLDDAIDNMKIKDGSWAEKLRTAGYRAIAGQFQSRGWGSHLKHRQWSVIKGYEEDDLPRILTNYLSGMAGIMTKQTAAADFLEMMKDVPKDQPEMFEGLSKYGKDQLRNSVPLDKFSQKARSFMFTYFLSGILRPAFVQTTQNFVTGIPEFAKYLRKNNLGGSGKADFLYIQAMKDIAAGKRNNNNNKNLSDIEQRLQAELFTDGITQDQYIQQIFGNLGDRFDKTYKKTMRWLATPFSWMEMFNRQSAALTMFRPAYELAMKGAISKEEKEEAYQKAFEEARSFVYNTHYAMDKANLPQFAQGGDPTSIGLKTLYTFRSFTHNFGLWMWRNLSSGDWKTALHSLAYMALFGGLMGLPFFKDFFEWIEKKFGYSPTKYVRNVLRGVGGETLETFGFSGLPAVLGMNISGSLAIGIPFMGETPADTVYGVYGGMATRLKRASEAAGRQDWYRVSTNIAPEFIRNPLAAAMESEYGKDIGMPGYSTTTRGRAIYGENNKPIQMTAGESALKTVGFTPTRNAKEKEQNQIIKRQEEWGQEAKRDLSETYRIEKVNRDPKAMQHLMAGVKEINQQIKDRGIQQLVPLVSVSTIIKNSRELMNKKQRKEEAYKRSAL